MSKENDPRPHDADYVRCLLGLHGFEGRRPYHSDGTNLRHSDGFKLCYWQRRELASDGAWFTRVFCEVRAADVTGQTDSSEIFWEHSVVYLMATTKYAIEFPEHEVLSVDEMIEWFRGK